ncbi:hypothetical protein E2562_018001 [Oryza meyeriana var. granulata]|uniref:Uncharacterized protein n=1 Tax=Oryza meyeriana var. granulata TaxID=110450 RepID=A0A6G1F949_9ORYZ|nr:hypothetical protein E2562_018001 [Oryza meyeriana var. granulata]
MVSEGAASPASATPPSPSRPRRLTVFSPCLRRSDSPPPPPLLTDSPPSTIDSNVDKVVFKNIRLEVMTDCCLSGCYLLH